MERQHIIIVDDEPGITALCTRVLSRAGFKTTAFTDPNKAIEFLRQSKVDLLLVDIRMPQVTGFEVIDQVKQLHPDIAILVMTGFGTVETAIQALRQGVDGLILKPFENTDELVTASQQALLDNQTKRDVSRMRALRPLFTTIESLISETRPDNLLELILNAVCGHLKCEHASFYQYSQDDNHLHLLSSRGITLPNELSSLDGGVVGRADALSAPVWVIANDNSSEKIQEQLEKNKLGSAICVPTTLLNTRSVVFAARGTGDPPFREVDTEMLLILARQSTIAMENARLYGDLRDYVKRVEESQQALLQAEKLATAGRMTASIAHEINNPLQSVQNCLHLAGRGDLSDDKRNEYFRLAEVELQRLMNTVHRMLEFYKPSRSSPQLHNVSDILHHILTLMSKQLSERKINVSVKAPDKPAVIRIIGDQIQQVFINIILNAFDAMPEGGDLEIKVQRKDKFIEIFFQDTGPGVHPDIRENIFDPFISSKESGTGLGLSVSYNIISAHGGTIDLIPGLKHGACFRVSLPVGDAK